MKSNTSPSEYEKLLAQLEGNEFEDEVCARLQKIYVDFQSVPAKPHGDGGLDGLSHGQSRAYCCYGPEQEVHKLDNKGLKDDIVKKFSSDLRRLFELEFQKRKLQQTTNPQLKSILGEKRKIAHVYLVVSWFESHKVIGALNTQFNKYKTASKLRFVDQNATLTIWGPKNLVTLGEIDEHALFRIQNRALLDSLQTAKPDEYVAGKDGDFDDKFNDLKKRRPASVKRIDAIAERLREAWAAAVALDNDLSKTSLNLHQNLETLRSNAALSANVKSMSSTDPYKLIDTMAKEVAESLEHSFGDRFGNLTPIVTQGVVAGLIGECPIDWRKDGDER